MCEHGFVFGDSFPRSVVEAPLICTCLGEDASIVASVAYRGLILWGGS